VYTLPVCRVYTQHATDDIDLFLTIISLALKSTSHLRRGYDDEYISSSQTEWVAQNRTAGQLTNAWLMGRYQTNSVKPLKEGRTSKPQPVKPAKSHLKTRNFVNTRSSKCCRKRTGATRYVKIICCKQQRTLTLHDKLYDGGRTTSVATVDEKWRDLSQFRVWDNVPQGNSLPLFWRYTNSLKS